MLNFMIIQNAPTPRFYPICPPPPPEKVDGVLRICHSRLYHTTFFFLQKSRIRSDFFVPNSHSPINFFNSSKLFRFFFSTQISKRALISGFFRFLFPKFSKNDQYRCHFNFVCHFFHPKSRYNICF